MTLNPRIASLAPKNPTEEDLLIHIMGKHKELHGYLCPSNQETKKEWQLNCTNNEISVFSSPYLQKQPTIIARKIEMQINAPIEKIISVASDCKSFYKIAQMVESVHTVDKMGEMCISMVKGMKPSPVETPREAVLVSHTMKDPKFTTCVRTSVEIDNVLKVSEGTIRQYIDVSGFLLFPDEKVGVTNFKGLCISDSTKPFLPESMKQLDSICIESAKRLKKQCEESM